MTRYPSGKNNPSSRAAETGESLPCTMFSPISVAKSPRIDPGGAWIGLVGTHQRAPGVDRGLAGDLRDHDRSTR